MDLRADWAYRRKERRCLMTGKPLDWETGCNENIKEVALIVSLLGSQDSVCQPVKYCKFGFWDISYTLCRCTVEEQYAVWLAKSALSYNNVSRCVDCTVPRSLLVDELYNHPDQQPRWSRCPAIERNRSNIISDEHIVVDYKHNQYIHINFFLQIRGKRWIILEYFAG